MALYILQFFNTTISKMDPTSTQILLFFIYNPNWQWFGSIEGPHVKLFSVLKAEMKATLHLLLNKKNVLSLLPVVAVP